MTATVAEMFPARTDGNGTTWYRAADSFGWTADPVQADPSYGVDNTDTVGYSHGDICERKV